MNAATAAEAGRAFAESLMTSECVIRLRGSGESVTDPETGAVTFPPGDVVYAGPCRIRPASGPGGTGGEREAGGEQVLEFDYLVSVPFSVVAVRERHRVAVVASPDPALVGLDLEVQHVDRGDTITARRLQCVEVA